MCRTGKSNCRAAKWLSRQLTSCRTYAVRNQQSEKESKRQNLLTHPARMVDAVQLGRMVIKAGEEVYSIEAPEGESLEIIRAPDIPEGVYLLKTTYESPFGEVEYGFKVELFE